MRISDDEIECNNYYCYGHCYYPKLYTTIIGKAVRAVTNYFVHISCKLTLN